ncbi:MAG: hypothetical protein KDA20_12565 [Phycisphaerales bacterium]|nr:hypothetical protein [Phycisphaerales bacterium]
MPARTAVVAVHDRLARTLILPNARDAHPPIGRLEVICGPMFAGKTTRLLHLLGAAQGEGLDVQAVKPALDNRYHATRITTHTGTWIDSHVIHAPDELARVQGDVVGLDEAHFFTEGLHRAVSALLERGTRVLLAGLDRTSMNEPFHEMGLLLVEADEVHKLTAPCAICGRPAVHTIRLFDSTEPIVIGGEGMFENRCRAHLRSPRQQTGTPPPEAP